MDDQVIIGWECPRCLCVFENDGWCHFCGGKLKPMVEQIDEL